MATREGTRASAEFICVSLAPDVCKSPSIPVPYKILSLFDCAVNFSTNVRFRTRNVFRHNSRLSTVRCDEPGVGGGVLSGVNMGYCRPISMTHSKTVRVNGSFVDYHVGTYMFMNCAGPEGPFNTIGQVIFLGNMLPGPVSPSGKIPKSSIDGSSGILSDIQSSLGDVEGLIAKGKKLYELAKTDWSDPSSVLGAIGGVAGIAGLQDVADMAKTAKDLYDKGKQIAQTDWSNPKQALAALAGIANVAGMDGIAKATELASKVRDAIKADWKDPKAALAAATNIMKGTGLNKMVAALASDLITTNDSNGASNPLPTNFPKPGASQANSNGSSPSRNTGAKATNGMIPESPEGNPRLPITSDVLAEMKEKNPLAYRRIMDIQESTGSIPPNAFVEVTKPAKDKKGNPIPDSERTAVYVPGEGFSTTPNERESSSLWTVPDGIREVFVAGSGPSVGEFFGMKQKEGNWYLFGGLIDLGSPEMPGAGAGGNAWWVPDKIFGMDFSKYYDYHDKHYYGNDVRLGDMGKILGVEANAFSEGLGSNPLQWPFQALYSGATTTVGTLTALDNSLKDILGKGDFSSLKDFFGNVFGESPLSPNDLGASNIVAGGCVGPEVPTLPGQSAPGTGSGAPGQGVPPAKGKAGAPGGNASGAGQDGVLITTAQGNPAAAAAAIEAAFRKDNQEALNKAQSEERAKQEQAAKEKAAKEKADKEKAEDKKPEEEKAENEKEKDPKKDEAEKEKTDEGNRNASGGKHYSKEEVEAILKDIKDKNLFQSYLDHFGDGKYDFKVNEPNATFDVDGKTMNSGEFGNFLAGYAGVINGGLLGELGVRGGGVLYDFFDSIKYDLGWTAPPPAGMDPPKFDFDRDSWPAINAGVERARKSLISSHPELQLPPGHHFNLLFPGMVVTPEGNLISIEEAKSKMMA